jgi:asparagine synthase (glutamine-hydrolysing)
MLLDFKTWLVDDILTKSDRMSMAASIEARAPYLDRRIIEFATSLPVGVRLRGWQTKTLLREALRDHIPQAALRRRKRAFRVPVDSWLASAFSDSMKDLLLASDSATGTVLRQDSVRRLFASASPLAARQLWTLGMLEIWMRQVLRTPRPAPSL